MVDTDTTDFEGANLTNDLIYLFLAVLCVLCAGLAAGMTIGLLSLDKLKLQIKLQVGSEKEKEAAGKILPVIANHHYLLCTLLLFNALANETLPIFLDELLPTFAAVIVSVTFVLLCGEIIPNAIFTGPNQLTIAARFINIVLFLEFIFFPLAYPLGKLLDRILGHEGDENLNRDELTALVQIIRDNGVSAAKEHMKKVGDKRATSGIGLSMTTTTNRTTSSDNQPRLSSCDLFAKNDVALSETEVNVITGALSLTKQTAGSICIPFDSVNMLSIDQILDQSSIDIIDRCGHSRLPVFKGPSEARDIIGYLLVKKLVKVNPEKAIPLRSLLPLSDPIVIGKEQTLLEVLSIFQSRTGHMALVSENPKALEESMKRGVSPSSKSAPVGILTVEDLFKHMTQSEIKGEADEENEVDRESASLALREMSFRSSSAVGGKNMDSDLLADLNDIRGSLGLERVSKSGTGTGVSNHMVGMGFALQYGKPVVVNGGGGGGIKGDNSRLSHNNNMNSGSNNVNNNNNNSNSQSPLHETLLQNV